MPLTKGKCCKGKGGRWAVQVTAVHNNKLKRPLERTWNVLGTYSERIRNLLCKALSSGGGGRTPEKRREENKEEKQH